MQIKLQDKILAEIEYNGKTYKAMPLRVSEEYQAVGLKDKMDKAEGKERTDVLIEFVSLYIPEMPKEMLQSMYSTTLIDLVTGLIEAINATTKKIPQNESDKKPAPTA